ncbi:MAG TPA: hypothetical protein VEJ47_18600 [Candidatus Eremiobacteraceae bacterium]|nr:hypothetical protein [Candidatus Eremiobacteraceae bacterium]
MPLTKPQRERIILAALLVVAAVIWLLYFGRSTATGGLTGNHAYTPINAEDYSVIFKDLGESQSTVYKSSGRNIFVEGPAPVAPTAQTTQASTAPKTPSRLYPTVDRPPEPPPPVLSMKFFGYGTLPGNGARRAFLLDGDDIHIVAEGDTVQNHIRITRIGNDRIEYEDTVTGKKNSTNLELPPVG